VKAEEYLNDALFLISEVKNKKIKDLEK